MSATESSQHASNLRSARRGRLKKAKKNVIDAVNAFGLMKHIDPFIDWLFAVGLILAILKDALDIINTVFIAVIGIGEVFIIILTFFISIIIFLIMMITGSVGKGRLAKKAIKRILMIIGTALIEIIPAIGLLPMETILITITFWMTLVERKQSAQGNQ